MKSTDTAARLAMMQDYEMYCVDLTQGADYHDFDSKALQNVLIRNNKSVSTELDGTNCYKFCR